MAEVLKIDNNREIPIKISVDMNDFEGVTAHMFQLTNAGTEARIDCIYLDHAAVVQNAPEVQGKVVARINMSQENLRKLYELLAKHFDKA